MRLPAFASLLAFALAALPVLAAAQAANPEGEPKQPLSNRPSATLVPERGAGTATPAEAFVVPKGSAVTIRIVSQDVRSQKLLASLATSPCGQPARDALPLAPVVHGNSDTTLRGAAAQRFAHGTQTVRVSDEHGKPLLCGALNVPRGAIR
ncbi:MAG TPA: hypothetical protein VMD91_03015 [Candidatus Sulfotelmatobacter sp.]|nr:hypothetical protein [Candidatus Sulfotelmatobacter sp.]